MRPLQNMCPHIGYCALARDDAGYSPELARILRTKWCRNVFRDCARYHIAKKLGVDAVPVDFFPVEFERASAMIAAARNT